MKMTTKFLSIMLVLLLSACINSPEDSAGGAADEELVAQVDTTVSLDTTVVIDTNTQDTMVMIDTMVVIDTTSTIDSNTIDTATEDTNPEFEVSNSIWLFYEAKCVLCEDKPWIINLPTNDTWSTHYLEIRNDTLFWDITNETDIYWFKEGSSDGIYLRETKIHKNRYVGKIVGNSIKWIYKIIDNIKIYHGNINDVKEDSDISYKTVNTLKIDDFEFCRDGSPNCILEDYIKGGFTRPEFE